MSSRLAFKILLRFYAIFIALLHFFSQIGPTSRDLNDCAYIIYLNMTEHIQNEDAAYWRRLKSNDPEALGYLYDKYVDKLFMSAMRTCNGDRELAKDSVQEVFIVIWNYRHSIADAQYPEKYLSKVLRSIVIKKLKKEKALTHAPLEESFVSPDQDIESLWVSRDSKNEKSNRLQQALDKLSQRQKQVLDLHFNRGMSYEQIAEMLSINYQSVNNLAFRSILRLRSLMVSLLLCFCLVK